jgi:hypothetical protein
MRRSSKFKLYTAHIRNVDWLVNDAAEVSYEDPNEMGRWS